MKSNLKIKEIVKEIPTRNGKNNSKYQNIYDLVSKLKKNEYLPIECKSSKEAATFRLTASMRDNIKAQQRENIVYLSRKDNK